MTLKFWVRIAGRTGFAPPAALREFETGLLEWAAREAERDQAPARSAADADLPAHTWMVAYRWAELQRASRGLPRLGTRGPG